MNWLARLLFSRGKINQRASKQLSRIRPSLETLEDRTTPSSTSAIAANFNGSAIPAGDTIWFNSVLHVSGLGRTPVTINVDNGSINFSARGTAYHVAVPNATVTFTPGATSASTTFSTAANSWVTAVPSAVSGNVFLDGVALPVTNALPGGISHVTWQADFQTNTAGVSVSWKWAAAVYRSFSTNYNAVEVKPVHSNHLSVYANFDRAGTPEAFKSFVAHGARGNGGSNWTGFRSDTGHVIPVVVAAPATLSGYVLVDNSASGQPNSGLTGVTVTVTGTTSTGVVVTLTTTTNASGFYSFGNLQAGTYTVSETPPTNYHYESATAGTVGGTTVGTVSSDTINGITLRAGNAGVNYNFLDGGRVLIL